MAFLFAFLGGSFYAAYRYVRMIADTMSCAFTTWNIEATLIDTLLKSSKDHST